MTPVGIMILVHPAILLLLIGSSLIITGLSWLLLFRKFSRRNRILCTILLFVVACMSYGIFAGQMYESPIVHIEIINGLR